MKIKLTGKIEFEVENKTKKHHNQSSWKRVVMIMLDGDVTEYYAWFIEKRYNLILNKPLRGGHITLINDSIKDLSCGTKTIQEIDKIWARVKNKWDKRPIPVFLDIEPRSDGKHWWLRVSHDERELMNNIRAELGLGKPYWGLHMSLGYANEIHEEHSNYLHEFLTADSSIEANKISANRSQLLLDIELTRKAKLKKSGRK